MTVLPILLSLVYFLEPVGKQRFERGWECWEASTSARASRQQDLTNVIKCMCAFIKCKLIRGRTRWAGAPIRRVQGSSLHPGCVTWQEPAAALPSCWILLRVALARVCGQHVLTVPCSGPGDWAVRVSCRSGLASLKGMYGPSTWFFSLELETSS